MKPKRPHFLLATLVRFAAYFISSAAAVTAIVLSLDYQRHLFELSRSEDQEALRLSLASRSITRDLREVFSDLRTLAHLQILAQYLDSETRETRTRVENAFVNVGESSRIYDQIRYIDRSGMEKIRVNFRGSSVIRVPASRLQDKSGRYYVTDTLKLGKGEIYISRLDLNMEKGKIERPFKPMIRAATPVFNSNGDLKGVVVVNYLAEEILADFRQFMAGSWGESNLVNAWGYWIYSPYKQDEWGFMFGRDISFAKRYPDAWKYILQHESGRVKTATGLFMFATARPYSTVVMRDLRIADGNVTERFWKLISWVPLPRLAYSPLHAIETRYNELLGLWGLIAVLSLLLAALRSEYSAKSKALRESERQLGEAQQLAHVGNWVWDISSSSLSWSAETYRIFGLTPQHSVNYDMFAAMIHPDDRNMVREAINAALQRKVAYDIDHRIVRNDNTLRTVHERGTVTFDKNGSPIRMFGTVQDITERKTTEEKLRESEERFRQLAETIDDVFWLVEWPQNRVIYVSLAFERIWGLTAQHLYNNPMAWLHAIVTEDHLHVERVFLEEAAIKGFDLTYRITRPDGEMRWIHDRAFPIRDEQGEVYRIAGVASDITTRVEAEQELQRYRDHLEQLVAERTAELQASNRELESFNYSLAHDLRTPLRAVTSFGQILSQEAGSKLSLEELDHLQRITKAGKHMASLLDGIAELGRISRSKMKYRTVDLSAIAHKVTNQLQRAHPQRSVSVTVSPHMLCEGDSVLLTIVVRNLLENAWKNTIDRSEAHIDFGEFIEHGITTYYVRDNGVGFNMKHANRIFEPFQLLHNGNEQLGTGIGLAAVHRIILRHKGRVWAKAVENAGATFYFTLAEPRKGIKKRVSPRQTVEPEI